MNPQRIEKICGGVTHPLSEHLRCTDHETGFVMYAELVQGLEEELHRHSHDSNQQYNLGEII